MSLFATVLIGGMAIGGPIVTLEVAYAGDRAPYVIGAIAAAATALAYAMRGRPTRRDDRITARAGPGDVVSTGIDGSSLRTQ